jgi:hypothetical protein
MKAPRYSSVELLVTLALLFVSAPFVEDMPGGDWIEAVLVTAVMVAAVFAVGGRRGSLAVALGLLVPALAARWLDRLHPGLVHPVVLLVVWATFFGFVTARLLRFIVRAPQVDANVLCAGMSGFLILGILWIPAYVTVERLSPGAFQLPATVGGPGTLSGYGAFYFSFVTLCTVGYGDIAPVSNVARMLALTEAITGLFYMAILISRLVSLHASHRHGAPPPGPPRAP